MQKGYPSLNIPPLDPLNRQATLYEYKSGPLRVLMSAKDTAIYGLSRSQLTNVRCVYLKKYVIFLSYLTYIF